MPAGATLPSNGELVLLTASYGLQTLNPHIADFSLMWIGSGLPTIRERPVSRYKRRDYTNGPGYAQHLSGLQARAPALRF
jgi:hypothetical protein